MDPSECEVRVHFLSNLQPPERPESPDYLQINGRVLIIAPQAKNGIYVWQINNPLYFKLKEHHERPFGKQYNIITIQIRFNYNLIRALRIHKCWFNFKFFITLFPRGYDFLHLFKSRVLYFLNDFGFISVNNVIRDVSYFVSSL